jgi:hypothetical protein
MIIITPVYCFAGEVQGSAALAIGGDDRPAQSGTIGHRF